jgi:DUF1365 family protein
MSALHLAGRTSHARLGAVRNAFSYRLDYLLLDPEAEVPGLARNRRGLVALHDRDHGGAPGRGRGAAWVREILAGLGQGDFRLRLLTQPRLFGHVFNPVSFWLCEDAGGLRLVIAEVTNTYGDRHSYLCHHDDFAPIQPQDELIARKVFHVSPFQDIAGSYRFRFDIRPDHLAIRIAHEGLIATLTGPLQPLTRARLWVMVLRRPLGARRVMALIHWQALKLFLKGAGFRPRPEPPQEEVSR